MCQDRQKYLFIYDGVEYDASGYVLSHPGGKQFLDRMKAERKDFTEYFKCLHSEDAQKILKSFPVVSRTSPSPGGRQYLHIYEKVKHLYRVRWELQILLVILLTGTFLTACFTKIGILSIVCHAFSQAVVSWVGHSMDHSRNKKLNWVGRVFSSLMGGFCLEWWSYKHNLHHIFTNSETHDEDLKHNYGKYLYPFLYFKWRYDSLYTAITKKNWLDTINILINYSLILYCRQNLIYFVLGVLLSGTFSAFVVTGNHERELRYNQKIEGSFIDHQVISSRNYHLYNVFWLVVMGGMQYQTEHHMFPQIPFYNLPQASKIIKEELEKLNKSMVYGPVI